MKIDSGWVHVQAVMRAQELQEAEPMTRDEYAALVYQFERDIIEEIQEGWDE